MHMWSLEGDHYPWLLPTGGFAVLPQMDKLRVDYVVSDYLADAADQNVVATVHCEALWDANDSPTHETDWLDSLDKSSGVALRYVAGVPFGRDDSVEILERQASYERVVGVRQTIAWHPQPSKSPLPAPGLALDPAWRKSASHLARLGLSLDLLMFPWQASDVVDLARADRISN
jgi:predicted TIM-barrel fold metal-dependent hydrolase